MGKPIGVIIDKRETRENEKDYGFEDWREIGNDCKEAWVYLLKIGNKIGKDRANSSLYLFIVLAL